MLAGHFDGGEVAEDFAAVEAVEGFEGADLGFALGEDTGLVESEGLQLGCGFEVGASFDEDAAAGGAGEGGAWLRCASTGSASATATSRRWRR